MHQDAAAVQPGEALHVRRTQNYRGRGDRLRSEILDAALRLLDAMPGSDLSLRAVARQAGITAPSIYPHFASREDLLAEVIKLSWQGLANDMERAGRRAASKSPRQALIAEVRAYIRYATASPMRYATLFGLQNRFAASEQFQQSPTVEAVVVLRRAVGLCIASGYTTAIRSEVDLTLLILTVIHGRIALAHAAPGWQFSTPSGITRFVEHVVEDLVLDPPSAD